MTSNVRFVSHTRIVVTTLLDGLNKVSKYVCTNIGIHYDRAGDTRDFDYDPELLLMTRGECSAVQQVCRLPVHTWACVCVHEYEIMFMLICWPVFREDPSRELGCAYVGLHVHTWT